MSNKRCGFGGMGKREYFQSRINTMKKSFLLRAVLVVFLGLTMTVARAQYVPIPDANFGTWLYNNGYSSCLRGNSVNDYQSWSAVRINTFNSLIIINQKFIL
jgi:hypothetical protein